VETLERAPRRAATLALVVALGAGVLGARGCLPERGEVRMATFNIRRFGVEPTDMDRLSAMVGSLGADVIAVQEVQKSERLDELAGRLGRRWRTALSACGGRREMHVGFLYNAARLRLREVHEFRELLPEEGGCTDGDRPGLLAVFEGPDGQPLHALTLHLKAGGRPDDIAQRERQWQRVEALLALLRQQGAGRVVVLGDVNSTGFLDNTRGERDLIEQLARRHSLDLARSPLACTEYYQSGSTMQPSFLDHALVSGGRLVDGSTAVHSHCAELRCTPQKPDAMPPTYTDVSDHCPVTFAVR
ncbi:MAG: hypothetical protein EOO75_00830, partial [Myxococcales bacterium]